MVINLYRTKAELNYQVYKNLQLLGWSGIKSFKVVIVAHEVDNDNAMDKNEWNGYAQTIKKYLRVQIDTKVDALQKIMSAQAKATDATNAKVDALEAKIDAKMDAILELLSKKQE